MGSKEDGEAAALPMKKVQEDRICRAFELWAKDNVTNRHPDAADGLMFSFSILMHSTSSQTVDGVMEALRGRKLIKASKSTK